MGKFLNLSGQVFGRLRVVGPSGKTNSGGYTWHCKCICGEEKVIPSDHLVRKTQPVLSCGCYRNDQIRKAVTSPDETAFNLLLGSYKKRARIKDREFKLTNEQFLKLTKDNCFYCGQCPATISENKPKTGKYIHNGVDRVDSSIGYVFENCVPCCKNCNYMKRNLSSQEFLGHIQQISIFQKGSKHD